MKYSSLVFFFNDFRLIRFVSLYLPSRRGYCMKLSSLVFLNVKRRLLLPFLRFFTNVFTLVCFS